MIAQQPLRLYLHFQLVNAITKESVVLKTEEPDETHPMIRFSATFPCPSCKKKLEFRMTSKKLVNNERGKLFWNLSNFQSHVKLQYKPFSGKATLETLERFITPRNTIEPTPRNEVEVDQSSSISSADIIEIAEESSDSEEMVKAISKKRKYNVIAEDEEKEKEISGEAMSGVLAEQNTSDPVHKTML